MSSPFVTVEQAAEELRLHSKTVLRYIRDGRLAATRIGKSYRITRSELDAFAGVASGHADTTASARTTCIVDILDISVDTSARIATFLQSAAMTGDAGTPPLHLETAFDTSAGSLKVVMIGSPSDVARLLDMLHLQLRDRR